MTTTLVNNYRGIAATTPRSSVGEANLGLLGGIVMRLSSWVGERRRYRQTMNELSALTDRELDDIGMTRGDIESVAQRCARGR
jgi:uncharacterized protein YjiS (DUF1127 family)